MKNQNSVSYLIICVSFGLILLALCLNLFFSLELGGKLGFMFIVCLVSYLVNESEK